MINETADQLLKLMALSMLDHLRDPEHDTLTLITQARQTAELAQAEAEKNKNRA